MKHDRKILLIFSALFFALFFMALFNLGAFSAVDSAIRDFSVRIQISQVVLTAKTVGFVFEPINVIVLALLACFFIFVKGLKKESLIFSIAMLFSGGVLYVIKEIVARARPENSLIYEPNASFPSGHMLASVVFFGFIAYLLAKKTESRTGKYLIYALSAFAMLIVGLSRLYLNAHWLSDVAGGFFLGIAILLVSICLERIL